MRTPAKILRDLPVLWKILVPFIVFLLLLGWVGTFFIVRNLSSRAEVALDQDLGGRLLNVRAALQGRELSLLESANLTANLQGMSQAVKSNDRVAITRLLRSVLALKTDLTVAAVADARGRVLVSFERDRPEAAAEPADAAAWRPGDAAAGAPAFIKLGGKPFLRIAAPICTGDSGCTRVGVAVVAVDATLLVRDAPRGTSGAAPSPGTIAMYDRAGRVIVSQGGESPERVQVTDDTGRIRLASGDTVTLVAPLEVLGTRLGAFAVTLPKAPAFAAVRGTGIRLALILLAAMIGVITLGAFLSRFMLAQVRPLVATNRALEQGILSARAPVLGRDELGELAGGLNRMADSLQESHENLEAKVEERTGEIQRLMQERTDFFAALSHELRTPLAIVLTKVDMLLDPVGGTREIKTRNSSQTIRHATEQVLSVVNEILELARSEAGPLEVVPEPIRMDELLGELDETMRSVVEAAGLTITIDLPDSLPPIVADRILMRKAVLNLIDNAAKYTPSGGSVTVRAQARPADVELSISDTGVGIPVRARDRVFDPFYRVEGTTAQRGQASTGLGLAVCKRVVEAQGGSIRLVSRPGKGSRFIVTMPRATEARLQAERVTAG